jgi:outer membrane protein assembly factor BamD (BamD/ComL family)
MTKWNSLFALLIMAALTLVGCAKNDSSGTVDTTRMETAFSTAEAPTQTRAQKAVTALKTGDYTSAVAQLKDLANDAKVTPEQKKAVMDTLAAAQEKIAKLTEKAAENAGKAIDDVKQGLPK